MPENVIELKGHIIDSLILPRVLTAIMEMGGNFDVETFTMGKKKDETSFARIRIQAEDDGVLSGILEVVRDLGAVLADIKDVRWEEAPADGVFPEGFYATTNLKTELFTTGGWMEVKWPEMDCAVRISPDGKSAETVTFSGVKKKDRIVVGHQGVRVHPLERSRERELFEFMGSGVSSEKPKGQLIARIATEMKQLKKTGGKILVVAGPAVIHTGAGPYLSRMITGGFVDVLFAGNALAVHDIEYALFGTSLGVYLDRGIPAAGGHEHHIRAINAIRSVGGVVKAVEQGVLTSGVMHAVVTAGVPFVLAGSIRDDGPLPDVITDSQEAQEAMRALARDVDMAIIIATTLHAVATGNMLSADVRTIAVDINPAVVTKLGDRGSFQTLGLVTDSESFLRELSGGLSV